MTVYQTASDDRPILNLVQLLACNFMAVLAVFGLALTMGTRFWLAAGVAWLLGSFITAALAGLLVWGHDRRAKKRASKDADAKRPVAQQGDDSHSFPQVETGRFQPQVVHDADRRDTAAPNDLIAMWQQDAAVDQCEASHIKENTAGHSDLPTAPDLPKKRRLRSPR